MAGCAYCVQPPHIPAVQPYVGHQNQALGAEPHVCLPGESPAPCVLSLQDPLGVCFLPDSLPGAVLHPPHHILHQPWVGAPRPARLLSGSPMGPHNRAGVRAAAGLCPRVGALGAGVGGLGATFPAAQVGTVCSSIMGCFAFPLAMTRGAAGAHTHLGIMQHTALSSSKRSLHHLSSSHLPSAWEVSAIASPSRSSGDAAKLWGALLEQARSRARQHAWHGAGEVQRGIPQLGSAGTCQEQTLLLLYLPGPALAQHGTIWHSMAQHPGSATPIGMQCPSCC